MKRTKEVWGVRMEERKIDNKIREKEKKEAEIEWRIGWCLTSVWKAMLTKENCEGTLGKAAQKNEHLEKA